MQGGSEKFIEDIHQQVQDDLGYAQSHYRKRTVTSILAKLNSSIHVFIAKQNKFGSIKNFFLDQVPEELFSLRKYMLFSLIIVAIGFATGYLGYLINSNFANAVMGDGYVSTTLENIEKGDPLGIYKSQGPFEMFTYITLNNLRVALLFFILGSLFALGSGIIIYSNGLMLGVFTALLVENGEGYQYFLTVYQHGTLEILTMVVEGAAGLCIGMSVFSPGKLSKLDAMKKNAKTGAIVILGTFPIIVLAGFIESFLTRFTELHDILRLLVILISLVFMVYYFIFYPWAKYRHKNRKEPVPFKKAKTEELAFYLRKNFLTQAIESGAKILYKKWRPLLILSILNLGLFWFLRQNDFLTLWGEGYLELHFDYYTMQTFQAVLVEFITQPFYLFSAALGSSFSTYMSIGVFLSFTMAFAYGKRLNKNLYLHLVFASLAAIPATALCLFMGQYSLWLPLVLVPVFVVLMSKWDLPKVQILSFSFLRQVILVTIADIAVFVVLTIAKTTLFWLLLFSGNVSEDLSLFRELNISFAIFLVPAYIFFVMNACRHLIPLLIEQKNGEKINRRIKQIKPVQSSYGMEVEL